MALVTIPGGWVDLRPITGHDEYAVSGSDLPNALHLINRLLVETPGALLSVGEAAALSSAARDRLLAAIFVMNYGARVASSAGCTKCGARFDLSFNLPELVKSMPCQPIPPEGMVRHPLGFAFRLPTGSDELHAIGLPSHEARAHLLHACILDGDTDSPNVTAAFDSALEEVAPLLSLDLTAHCPVCGTAHTVAFDMQTYLLGRIVADQARLSAEVHALALTYRWGLNEILSLTRAHRHRYLNLIEADASRTAARSVSMRRRIS